MTKPKDCIPVLEAKTLQANWNGSSRSKDAPYCITFDIDQLQEYIDYVKSTSKFPNPGIRVYFASYDKVAKENCTVFLSASEDNTADSENDYSVDPLNRGQNGWPPFMY